MESFWEELEGVYICNKCKYYSEQASDRCPKCKCEMLEIKNLEI